MDSKKYIGMDVHKESISIAVMNGAGTIGCHRDLQGIASSPKTSRSIAAGSVFSVPLS